MKKIIFIAAFLSIIGSTVSYSGPQIVEVTDNFGNVYDVKSEWGHEGNTFARIYNREQELTISEDTQITLCVTEVKHEEDREVQFSFDDNPNPDDWKTDNCHTFDDYSREDYAESLGWFHIYVKDDADVTASYGYDFEFQLAYRNTSLTEDNTLNTESTVYEAVEISQSEFDRLKSKSDELESKNEEILTLENQLGEKNSTINQLRSEINQKESKIKELNNRVRELETRVEELEGGFLNSLASLF